MKRLIILIAAVLHTTASAHTFTPLTNPVPPESLNLPVGVADGGSRVVGQGVCFMGAGWCSTQEGFYSFIWTPADGFQEIDYAYDSVLNLAANQHVSGLDLIDASADAQFVTGNYGITTQFGTCCSQWDYGKAFRWSETTGFDVLGHLDGLVVTQPTSISADGQTVVGYVGWSTTSWGPKTSDPPRPGGQAVRWTPAGGLEYLGVPSFIVASIATLVSDDGGVIAGQIELEGDFNLGFHWTPTTGFVGIGDLPGGGIFSYPTGMSADGSVLVGNSSGAAGSEAFRWDIANGMVGLGVLPNQSQSPRSDAWAVSADGTVVVGSSTSGPSGGEAFRWDAVNGMVGLGSLPGGNGSSARYVSPDGSVIIGTADSPVRPGCPYWCFQSDVFIWTQATGILGLRQILTDHGYDLTAWETSGPEFILEVSPDGKSFVVSTTNVDNNSPYADGYGSLTKAFLVNIDVATAQIEVITTGSGLHVHHQGQGLLPDDTVTVAVMGADTLIGDQDNLDATLIDPTSLRFGPAQAEIDPASTPNLNYDHDGDELTDAKVEFKMSETGFPFTPGTGNPCSASPATLTGELSTGELFTGTDVSVDTHCNAQCH